MSTETLTLSADQSLALQSAALWWDEVGDATYECDHEGHAPYPHTHGNGGLSNDPAPVFALGGLAGTGKTTLTRLLRERLGVDNVAYGTPTHKAAAVLRKKLAPGEAGKVSTIHALAYYPRPYAVCRRSGLILRRRDDDGYHQCKRCGTRQCDVEEKLSFDKRPFLAGRVDLLVVDEASMLTREQVEDLRSFGVPLLLVGDHGQLPPVQAEMNPWMLDPDAVLEVNHRQGEGSGIVDLAYRVRGGYRPVIGTAGEGYAVLGRVPHHEAVGAMLERFKPAPHRAVVVWRNQTRAQLNRFFRGGTHAVQAGDRVVCLKSHEMAVAEPDPEHRWKRSHVLTLVHNGETGSVLDVLHVGEKTVTLVVELDGDRPAIVTRAARYQFGQERELPWASSQRPKGPADWWDYAYAITAHKAQGSEYEQVLVVDEGAMDYARWTYTAVTRAAKSLVVVRW